MKSKNVHLHHTLNLETGPPDKQTPSHTCSTCSTPTYRKKKLAILHSNPTPFTSEGGGEDGDSIKSHKAAKRPASVWVCRDVSRRLCGEKNRLLFRGGWTISRHFCGFLKKTPELLPPVFVATRVSQSGQLYPNGKIGRTSQSISSACWPKQFAQERVWKHDGSLRVTQRASVQPGPRPPSTLLFSRQADPNHIRSRREDNFLLGGCDVDFDMFYLKSWLMKLLR